MVFKLRCVLWPYLHGPVECKAPCCLFMCSYIIHIELTLYNNMMLTSYIVYTLVVIVYTVHYSYILCWPLCGAYIATCGHGIWTKFTNTTLSCSAHNTPVVYYATSVYSHIIYIAICMGKMAHDLYHNILLQRLVPKCSLTTPIVISNNPMHNVTGMLLTSSTMPDHSKRMQDMVHKVCT